MIFWKRIFIVTLAIGIFSVRYFAALPKFDATYAGSYRGQFLTIESIFIDEETVEAFRFERFGNFYPLRGKIRTSILDAADIEYGDKIILSGFLAEPFHKDPRIAAQIDRPLIHRIIKSDGNFFLRFMVRQKKFILRRLEKVFPEPSASFAAGLLLGSRNDIPREIMEDFKKTGLTHILAVSGYNIVILIAFTSAVFSIFPRKISFPLSLATIFIFVMLVGMSASVLRAALMGSLAQIARFFGRKSLGLRPLFIAGYIMALFDPFIVFFDIGFQLSFAATAGIILFSPSLKRYFPEVISTSWAAQILTTPFVIYYFKSFSLVAVLANALILPAIPFLMLGSFLSLIFGQLAAIPTWLLFEIVFKVTHALAEFPFAFIEVGIS